MTPSPWFWVAFNAMVLVLLALDLGVFHREPHAVSAREGMAWTALWVGLAVVFAGGVWAYAGPVVALQFVTGYVIEEALSLDNIFVIATIFGYFQVPARYQHRVLFWGIVGALVTRGAFVGVGAAMLRHFAWTMYVFGAIVVAGGIRMAFKHDSATDIETNGIVRMARRVLPLTNRYDGAHFFTRDGARRVATPLFLVLLVVEATDLLFAIDSIPAVFSVSRDPFVVYTSNVFAVLGLRSLYTVVAGAMHRVHLLPYGLAVVLVFIGAKMLAGDLVHLSIGVSLAVIVTVLLATIALSLARPPSDRAGGARKGEARS
ncbi:MAG: TerC family protein [Gemmatimonadaceae bacterium]